MFCSTDIGIFSTGVWQDLGSPTETSALTISGWVTQPHVLGKLNNYISTCYSGSGYNGTGTSNFDVVPALTSTEFSLLNQMYLVDYYRNLIRRCAGAGGSTRVIQQLTEGDEKVSFVSAADLARVYTQNMQEADKQLNYLVASYLQNSAGAYAPRTIDMYTIAPPGYAQNWSVL